MEVQNAVTLSKVQNAVNLSKIFFGIKLLHAHLQYICNIHAKYQINILKALGGVKNAVNLSKISFSANKFFLHIYNMTVTYLQSIKRIH